MILWIRPTGKDPYFHSGVLWKNDFAKHENLDMDQIAEHVAHSWYEGIEEHKPYDGVTDPNYTSYEDKDKYSWAKAPRYKGEPMETGPLARRAIAYARNESETKSMLDAFFQGLGHETGPVVFHHGGVRSVASIETSMLTKRMEGWIKETEDRIKSGDDAIYTKWTMPDTAQGRGHLLWSHAVPLSHWIKIKGGKIDNFQLVVPSTWNLGPRCAADKLSPGEQSLIGCPCPDPDRPVEILRTIHSYDPLHCLRRTPCGRARPDHEAY